MKNHLGITLLALSIASATQAADYVITAAQWDASRQAAVEAAGGTVRFAHAGAGVAVVSSERADFLDAIRTQPGISGAAPDRVVQWQQPTEVALSDAELDQQTAGNPFTNPLYALQWAPASVEAPAAWQLGYTGKGVRVAVLDGGLFDAHPDLAANVDVAASRSFVPGQAFNTDTGTFWHGTHVAGIVAARDNNTGVVGIAPEATIIGVKVLHAGSGAFSWVIEGLLYAADEGDADILNLSLGADFNRGDRDAAELVSALNRAVNYASRHGALVISAAGNDGYDLDHSGNLITVPAMSGNGVAISATGPMGWALGNDNGRRPSSYTNYGQSMIHVAGPGGDFAYPGNENCNVAGIVRPCWVFDMVLSTSRAGYSWAAGTSMAAPAAAGVAALIKQRFPDTDGAQLKSKLAQSADDEGKTGHDAYYGRGFVNARRAVSQ